MYEKYNELRVDDSMSELEPHGFEVLRDLDRCFIDYAKARQKFFAKDVDRVALIAYALKRGHALTVLGVAGSLSERERLQLFPEWLDLASNLHGHTLAARDLILSLPREWVIANIEELAKPILEAGSEDEYRRILELYRALGAKDLVEKLARRAIEHHDWEVREAGEDFLNSV